MKQQNRALYRKLSEPFESEAAANEALKAFQEELYELRVKYRIKDLAFVAQISIADGEEEIDSIVSNHYGDSTKEALLFGYAYGRAIASHEELPRIARNAGAKSVKP